MQRLRNTGGGAPGPSPDNPGVTGNGTIFAILVPWHAGFRGGALGLHVGPPWCLMRERVACARHDHTTIVGGNL